MSEPIWVSFLKAVMAFAITLGAVPLIVLGERRISAFIQYRIGPNRVGLFGSLQPLADVVKLLFKEEVRPRDAQPFLFVLAPAITTICALSMVAIVPFGGSLQVGDQLIPLVVANVDIGILVFLAASSIGVYGLTLGGWASRSKYSLLGGLRSSAQMISYELTLGISLLSVLLLNVGDQGFATLNLHHIVRHQAEQGVLGWNILAAPLAFVLFTISAFAETNRLPFDLPEAEPELVGGYHTEYSSMRFALFFLGEYAAMFVASAMIVCLFLGGWHLPGVTDQEVVGVAGAILQVLVFLAKISVLLFFFIQVRWTLPRLRYDQLMDLGWKFMLPLALLNLVVTGGLVAAGILGGSGS
jgi:NADH-quinone oxidoreductase subunit H